MDILRIRHCPIMIGYNKIRLGYIGFFINLRRFVWFEKSKINVLLKSLDFIYTRNLEKIQQNIIYSLFINYNISRVMNCNI